MNYEELFKQDAFNAISKATLEKFKVLSQNIQNKSKEEALVQIIAFNTEISQDRPLSQQEQDALIQTILISLPKEDRSKFLEALEIISKFM
ncbi:MAG: hypothetical protein R3Y29_06560 [bacterium]